MPTRSLVAGRALPVVLALLAVGALVFLLLGDPFGGSSGGGRDANRTDAPGDLLQADGASGRDGEKDAEGTTLTGRYGEGDLGAIRLRLLWLGSREPLVGQPVKLLSRRGTEVVSLPSDVDGRVLFAMVPPAQGYSLLVRGEGFSEVVLRGITVREQATTDLGEILLGVDVVLRGRVVDAAGRPVPGSSVSVHTIERELASKGMLFYLAEQAGAVPLPLQQVTSDEGGYFAFSQLDDGNYALVARHSGFGSRHESDVIVSRARGAGLLTVVLGNGGRVTGRVTDEDAKPIAGARVVAIRDVRRMSTNPVQREMAVTSDDGSYVIDTLEIGVQYRFGVLAEGYAPVYEVQGVDVTEKDVERNFTLVRGGNLEGAVVDAQSGKPVADARVALYVGSFGWGGRRGGRQVESDARAAADTRRTDKDGRFRFEALTPGPVASAVVKAAGYQSATFAQFPPPGNPWPEVVAGETQTVEVRLERGGTVRGVVRSTETRAPIQGAEVTVMASGWAAMGTMWVGSPSAITSADGAYELLGVPPGRFRVVALAEGYSPSGSEEGVELEMPEEGGALEKDLELTAAGTIEGVVTDPAGVPIAGVRIRLREQRPEGGQGRRGPDWARQILMSGRNPADLSDEKGAFRLEGVSSAAQWVVYGESEEYVSGETKPLKVSAGETKSVKLTMLPGGALRGQVVDENGRRLPGVSVRVGRLDDDQAGTQVLNGWQADRMLDPRVFTTDEEGRFLATNLKEGRTIVKATKEGYVTFYKRNVTIRSGETFENYTIALSSGETAEGTVLGADGRPLAGAMVALTTQADGGTMGGAGGTDGADGAADGEPSETVEASLFGRTDENGRWTIEHVMPGTYSAVVWFAPGHKGWARERDEAAIRRGLTVPVRDVVFKLVKAEPQEGGGFPGRGGGPRGPGGGGAGGGSR